MLRKGPAAAFLALTLVLSGCSLDVRADAAKGIARFLDAVHRGDRAAFEASIDRPALRSDLRGQLAELGKESSLDVGEGASVFALDRMITPQAFRLVEARNGQALPAAPSAAQVALSLQVRDRTHACVTRPGPEPGQSRCVLAFAKKGRAWRLVGMQATDLTVELPPAPAKGH
jgi:hypothetical protein